jgi:hypothetical protein
VQPVELDVREVVQLRQSTRYGRLAGTRSPRRPRSSWAR